MSTTVFLFVISTMPPAVRADCSLFHSTCSIHITVQWFWWYHRCVRPLLEVTYGSRLPDGLAKTVQNVVSRKWICRCGTYMLVESLTVRSTAGKLIRQTPRHLHYTSIKRYVASIHHIGIRTLNKCWLQYSQPSTSTVRASVIQTSMSSSDIRATLHG